MEDAQANRIEELHSQVPSQSKNPSPEQLSLPDVASSSNKTSFAIDPTKSLSTNIAMTLQNLGVCKIVDESGHFPIVTSTVSTSGVSLTEEADSSVSRTGNEPVEARTLEIDDLQSVEPVGNGEKKQNRPRKSRKGSQEDPQGSSSTTATASHECRICKQIFPLKDTLRDHLNSLHSGSRSLAPGIYLLVKPGNEADLEEKNAEIEGEKVDITTRAGRRLHREGLRDQTAVRKRRRQSRTESDSQLEEAPAVAGALKRKTGRPKKIRNESQPKDGDTDEPAGVEGLQKRKSARPKKIRMHRVDGGLPDELGEFGPMYVDDERSLAVNEKKKRRSTRAKKSAEELAEAKREANRRYQLRKKKLSHLPETEDSSAEGEADSASNNRVKCPMCRKTFASRGSFRGHMRELHGISASVFPPAKPDVFNCDLCPKICKTASDLGSHKRRAHAITRFAQIVPECPLCLQTFESAIALGVHMRPHFNEKNRLPCRFCGLDFPRTNSLKAHIRRKHAEDDAAERTDRGVSAQTEFPTASQHQCTICFGFYKTNQYLRKHIRTTHKETYENTKVAPPASAEAGEVVCDVCKRIFANRGALGAHKFSAHGGESRFQCKVCPIQCANQPDYSEHIKTHFIDGVLSCPKCDKTFTVFDAFGQHFRRRHCAPITCEVCGKVMASSSSLNDHMTAKHGKGGGFRFQCVLCQKRFRREWQQKAHVLKHHPEGLPLSTEVTLPVVRIHSRKAGKDCQFCSKIFTNRKTLGKHQRKEHSKNLQNFGSNESSDDSDDSHISWESMDEFEDEANAEVDAETERDEVTAEAGRDEANEAINAIAEIGQSQSFQSMSPNKKFSETITATTDEFREDACADSSADGEASGGIVSINSDAIALGVGRPTLIRRKFPKGRTEEEIREAKREIKKRHLLRKKQGLHFPRVVRTKEEMKEHTRLQKRRYVLEKKGLPFTPKQADRADLHYPICPVCKREFTDKGTFRSHMRRGHTGLSSGGVPRPKHVEGLFECDLCPKICKTPSDLGSHKRAAHAIKGCAPLGSECPICLQVLTSALALGGHVKIHWDADGKLPCRFQCGRSFGRTDNLRVHVRRMHAEEDEKERAARREAEGGPADDATQQSQIQTKHQCYVCNGFYSSQEYLNYHLRVIHKDMYKSSPKSATGLGEFKCDQCETTWHTPGALKRHKFGAHNAVSRFQCRICPTLCTNQGEYCDHMKTHFVDGVLTCPKCEKTFTLFKNFSNHFRQRHIPSDRKRTSARKTGVSASTPTLRSLRKKTSTEDVNDGNEEVDSASDNSGYADSASDDSGDSDSVSHYSGYADSLTFSDDDTEFRQSGSSQNV